MDHPSPQIRAHDEAARQPPALDYAPPLPAHWWRIWRFARWGLVLSAIILASRYGEVAWRRWEFLRLQAACLEAELPQDRPMMAVGFAQTRLLTAQSKEYQVNSGWALRMDPRWAQLQARLGLPALPTPCATLFMHERRTPSGQKRLVIVEASHETVRRGELIFRVIHPASLWNDARGGAPDNTERLRALWIVEEHSSDVYSPPAQPSWGAGIADQNDDSRFTIPMHVLGISENLRLRLEEDDTVTITLANENAFLASMDAKWMKPVAESPTATQPPPQVEPSPAQVLSNAITSLRDAEPQVRLRAAAELMRLNAASPRVLQSLLRACEAGDFAAREGLTLALERAMVSGKGAEAELAKAEHEMDPAARAFLNSANRAVAAERIGQSRSDDKK